MLRGGILRQLQRRVSRETGLRWTLVTLTAPHSGDLDADRKRIATGWARLRAWLHHRQGSLPYLLCWEITPGSDGTGHVHAHVLTLWPWLDYGDLNRAWSRAVRAESARIDVQRARSHRGAARYVQKYATKGCAAMGGTVAAGWYRATYGRRWASTSIGWWCGTDNRSECPVCGCVWELQRYETHLDLDAWTARGPPVHARADGTGAAGPGRSERAAGNGPGQGAPLPFGRPPASSGLGCAPS